ncbi:putative F-box protein At5g55150 [Macadamia integrifolia]|uniref:putative F-box protein At5g55150 n=1 Tax=Macadamia integrifolia TaxID=60698 RepID=UPI001C528077|nr:putative F-box protein At5g55150 [Macadamia integrifolia]
MATLPNDSSIIAPYSTTYGANRIINCQVVENITVALPEDIMMLIISKLDLLDFHCFSSVCKSWKSIAIAAKKIMPPQLPLLMLSSSEDQDHHDGFFSLSHNKVFRLKLPPEVDGARCCGSTWGWLVMVTKLGRHFLLNPLSGDLIELPPKATLPAHRQGVIYKLHKFGSFYNYIRKAMLLSPPIADDFVVIVIYCGKRLAFCRGGDETWTAIGYMETEDIIFYHGKLYAINRGFNLITVELGPRPKVTSCSIAPPSTEASNFFILSKISVYLVECLGELLMVIRYRKFVDSNMSKTSMFNIFKLNTEGKCWTKVKDLGDQMLFIDKSNGFSLSAPDYFGFRGNCIYFTDDFSSKFGSTTCKNLGVFRLEDNYIEFFSSNYLHSYLYLPIWFTPIW